MTWPDGDSVETDPRRDDPYFYYLRNGDWKTAVGFDVTPSPEDVRAASVSLSVAPPYLERIERFGDAEQARMYAHVVEALAKRYARWTRITISGATRDSLTGLAARLAPLGWQLQPTSPSDEVVLTRAS